MLEYNSVWQTWFSVCSLRLTELGMYYTARYTNDMIMSVGGGVESNIVTIDMAVLIAVNVVYAFVDYFMLL